MNVPLGFGLRIKFIFSKWARDIFAQRRFKFELLLAQLKINKVGFLRKVEWVIGLNMFGLFQSVFS